MVLPAKALRTSAFCVAVNSGIMFPKTNQNNDKKMTIDEARKKIAENFMRQLPPSFVLVMVASSLLALSPMAAGGSSSSISTSRSRGG